MAGAGAADLGAGDDLALAALALARRFAAGATMWCLAPAWPEHARHVAVEFVHPVIVGKRALPAVSVIDPDPVAALRATARAGDVLVGVSTADAPGVAPAMRRAGAWGLTSVWIGAGLRPPPGAADHVLWVDDPGGTAAFDGRLVLRYHLLWELTHVCFEHPGLLTPASTCELDDHLRHLLRRGTAGRGRRGARARCRDGPHGRRVGGDRHDDRRTGAPRRPRARARRSGDRRHRGGRTRCLRARARGRRSSTPSSRATSEMPAPCWSTSGARQSPRRRPAPRYAP